MSEDQPPFEGTTQSATTNTDIVALVEHNPVIVLVDAEKKEALFAHIEQEVADFKADVSTPKGREECRSFAAKIVRTKTTVDKSRLALTEEARQKIKSVNAEGSIIEERLKALAATARAPLTAWEEAEEKREGECKAALERLRTATIVPMDATADSLRTRITEVEAEPMHEDHWLGMLELAEKAKATALAALAAALALVEQKDRDAAELAELRAAADQRREAEEKLRQRNEYIDSIIEHITQVGLGMIGGQAYPYGVLLRELEEKVLPEIETFGERRDEVERHRVATLERVKDAMQRQQERAEKEAREAEEQRVAAEQARAAQTAQERAAAAEKAAAEARTQANAEADRRAVEQREAHEAELQAANARAAEIERQAEQDRAAREAEDARRAEQEAAAVAERTAREADQARRTAVKRAAKEAIMTVPGVTETQAQAIVILIIAGEVPFCLLDFAAEPKVRPASSVPGVGQGTGDAPEEGKLV